MIEEENETFFTRVWKPLPSKHVLKILRETSKRIISTSNVLGPLQMVSELDTELGVSEDAGLPRGGL